MAFYSEMGGREELFWMVYRPEMVEYMIFADACFLAALQLLMNTTDAEKIAPILVLIVEIRDIQYSAVACG
jgi:hypothetical protein